MPEPTVAVLAAQVADALSQQAELQVALLKAELARDVRLWTTRLLPAVAALPLIGLGYALACLAMGIALWPFLGMAAGLGLVGIANVIVGGVLLRRSLVHVG